MGQAALYLLSQAWLQSKTDFACGSALHSAMYNTQQPHIYNVALEISYIRKLLHNVVIKYIILIRVQSAIFNWTRVTRKSV